MYSNSKVMWVTIKEVKEDDGFYSDLYKDEVGVRPRHLTPEELTAWLNNTFEVKNKGTFPRMIVKKEK